MPNNNNNRTRSNTNNSVRTNNSTRRRRRGAITPNNARRIKGAFQKPPKHPGRPTHSPPPPKPLQSRARSITNLQNINIGNLSVAEMNALLRELA